MSVIIFMAVYLYLVVVVVGVLIFLSEKMSKKIEMIKLAIIVLPVCFLVAKISGLFISSPRPFIIENVQPIIQASVDNGFPSDHTLLAATIACLVFVYHKKMGAFLFLLAIGVGVGRVLVHVHHSIDIIGSIVIAASVTYLIYSIERRIFSK